MIAAPIISKHALLSKVAQVHEFWKCANYEHFCTIRVRSEAVEGEMSEKPRESFEREFRTKLKDFNGGKQLQERLEQIACGAEFIMMLLQVHCAAQVESPDREIVKSYLASRKSLADRLDKYAKSLSDVAAEIQKTAEGISNLAGVVPEVVSLQHARPLDELPIEIRSHVSLLAAASRQLRALKLRNAPMYALYQIAWYMKGNAEHYDYDELELLLEIGYAAFGKTKVLGREDLRHLLTRAEKKIPDWAKIPGWALL